MIEQICNTCLGKGVYVDFDGNVHDCEEDRCLKKRAVEILLEKNKAPEGAFFKGGEFKMSMAMGFELTSEAIKAMVGTIKGIQKLVAETKYTPDDVTVEPAEVCIGVKET